MLVLDSILAAGSGRSPGVATLSFRRLGICPYSATLLFGLRNPSSNGVLDEASLLSFEFPGGGAAGKRNSGIGFGDPRGDRRGLLTLAPVGLNALLPLRIRPKRSGG